MGVMGVIAEPNGYGFKSLFTSPLLDGFGQMASPLSVPQFSLLEDWDNNSLYLREVRRIQWVNNCKVLPPASARGVGFPHQNTLTHTPPHVTVQ